MQSNMKFVVCITYYIHHVKNAVHRFVYLKCPPNFSYFKRQRNENVDVIGIIIINRKVLDVRYKHD